MRLRPLLFRTRSCMQQDRVARCVARKASAVQPKIGRALRRIAKGQPGQDPVALDSVQIAIDTVAGVVKMRSQGLADA